MKKTNLVITLILISISLFAQWNPTNIMGTTEPLNDVIFLNNDTGYVVGGNWSSPSSGYFYTTDGGTTWNTSPISTYALWSVQFLNDTLGFISTTQASPMNLCYKTIDGGANWYSFNTALYNDGKIYFKDNNIGFHYSPNNGDDVAYSTNGGASWVHYPNGTFGGSGITDMYFPTESGVGYAVTAWGGEIYKTINDTIWTLLGQPTSQTYKAVYFVDDMVGYVLGTDTILKTIDGGINWSYANINQGGLDIYCVDTDTCYVLTYNSILKSTDGCTTFDAMTGVSGSLTTFCFSDNTAYAVGDTGNAFKLGTNSSIIGTTFENNIRIYPNPTSNGSFMISVPEHFSNNVAINIYSLDGRLAHNYQIDKNKSSIYIKTNLLNGFYFIELSDGQKRVISKIQINK